MAGYSTRQSTYTTGDVIAAADTNDEFNQLISAFNASTGHTHDGTAGDGGPVSVLRDSNAYNRILLDTSNNHLEFYVNVSSSSVQQLRIEDGAIVPITDNDIDLGTASLEFKNLYIDGTANIDSLVADTADINAGTVDAVIGGTTPAAGTFTTLTANTSLALASGSTVTSILDEDTMTSNSDTALATQQSIKAYVDSQVTAQDLDFIGDTGGAQSVDLDSQSLTIAGGTGIDSVGSAQTITLNIDSSVATLTDTQTLENKTLTTPVISSISNTGTITLPTSTDTLVGRATTDTLTNKTIDANGTGNSITNLEVADLASGVLDTDLTSVSASDDTLASAKAIKTYVDSQVTSSNELDELTDVNITSPSDGSLLFYDTTSSKWIDNVVSGDITIADTGVAAISSGVIVNADINASAAIDATKIHDGSISNTEFGYLNGVTSNIQTQLTSLDTLKAPLASPTFTGTVSAPTPTAGDSSTKVATTAFVTNAVALENELSEMNDVAITSVADADFLVYDSTSTKWENQSISGDVSITNTGVASINSGVIVNADVNASAAIDATKIHDGTVSNTEFGYLNGVTSAIQTQINSKATPGFAVAMAIAL